MSELADNVALQFSIFVLLLGATNWLGFRKSRSLRLLNRFLFWVLLSLWLLAHGSVPFAPVAAGGDAVSTIAFTLAKAAWWLLGSVCLVGMVRIFLIFERKPREARLLQDLVVAVIYVGGFLSIISYVFSVPVGTLVATSGVFAIILGLALQNTLSDVFSGIALNIGRPYSVGDWIVLEDGSEGRVVETNWRATHLVSGTNDLLAVPNSGLAKSRIVNRSSPDPVHVASVRMKFAVTTTPATVVTLMENALRSANGILLTPPPSARIRGLDAQGVELELSFRIAGISLMTAAKNEVYDLAFRHAFAAGVRLADPGSSSMPGSAPPPSKDVSLPGTQWRLVNSIPLLASLTEDERETLATVMRRRTFRKGDVIARQGEIFNALLILRSGVVSIDHDGQEILRLSPGDWFGEGGLLLGSAETGTSIALSPVVAFEIAQADIARLVTDRPAIADEIATILARRLDTERQKFETHDTARPAISLAARIRHLFAVSERPDD